MASFGKNTIALCLLITLVLFAANPSAASCPLKSCGSPIDTSTCCGSFNADLTDLEAAAILCAAIKANVLTITGDPTVYITATLGTCSRALPSGYTCSA